MEEYTAQKKSPDSRPPSSAGSLAVWFAEAVESEVAALEKQGGAQTYELLSGKLIEAVKPGQAVVQFIIADGLRIPEDASGTLKTVTGDYAATVIGQRATQINLLLEGRSIPAEGISRGRLLIDDTGLLRRLAEALQNAAKNPAAIGPLAVTIFHPNQATVRTLDLSHFGSFGTLEEEKRRAIQQACGSTLTYVWGPPGTGKTHLIAHLIAAIIAQGERILVTSHTHAAVDQALHEAITQTLTNLPSLAEGRILRVGRTPDRRVPDSVRLDKVIEAKAGDLQAKVSELESRLTPLLDRVAVCRAAISQWDDLAEAQRELQVTREQADQADIDRRLSADAINASQELRHGREVQLAQAQRAWFRRAAKVERASLELRGAEAAVRRSEGELERANRAVQVCRQSLERRASDLAEHEVICGKLPERGRLDADVATLEREMQTIQEQIRTLSDQMAQLERELIQRANAIFCTLTKNYMGRELEGQTFDAVVVDEISMALPPLLFLAGARVTRRAILVGDFLQLPPIIRSDVEVSNNRLGRDAFHLAGVATDNRPAPRCAVLCSLSVQRRMLPPIADVARHLVYGPAGLHLKDAPEVRGRPVPDWLSFLPANPLVIVDTADLRCWSGKQPGTLSRFNFYSATVSGELAAMAASGQAEPPTDKSQPIAIITPFSAQRRLLARLVDDMDLARWVAVGTVHTFQGSQAQLVIFDSVLDEPYWSARMCDPRNTDVIRELNVAVTRSESKFVFVGSSAWLNEHAKLPSGLGRLWDFLKDRADLESATDLVEQDFIGRVTSQTTDSAGWRLPGVPDGDGAAWEVLDETKFFARFGADIGAAQWSIFGLVPYFGEFRWPRIQPLFAAALDRGVEITLVTPPLDEAKNRTYVEKAVENLRNLGAVVTASSGLHGKDVVIDERIYYTGSLNWASHRGNVEIMHRIVSPDHAKLVLQYLQARFIRAAAMNTDATPRTCPQCGGPIHIVNQRQENGPWDHQALKVGCVNYQSTKCQYLRDVNERPPFLEPPRCPVDGRTKYRRARRRTREVWECRKHPQTCPREKVVPGDPR